MKKHNEDFENIKPIHKIIFAVCAVVILLTILAFVICCYNYPSAINFFTPATLPPVAVLLIAVFGFCNGIWGRVDKIKRDSWKYSKVDGKGRFENEHKDFGRIGKSLTGSCISIIVMTIMLPFVFFFSDKIKNLVGIIALVAIYAALFIFFIVIGVMVGVESKKEREKEKAEAERLRREQEEREQMGQWK